MFGSLSSFATNFYKISLLSFFVKHFFYFFEFNFLYIAKLVNNQLLTVF